jgi:hypothetical protein
MRRLVERGSGPGRLDDDLDQGADHERRLLGTRQAQKARCVLGMHVRERLAGVPDPDGSGQFPRSRVKFIDLDSPTFKSAWRACRELAPELAQEENEPSPAQRARDLEKLLEFAVCMRANGVPKFPDPDADGGLTITRNGGLDPNSPQFKAADKACMKLLPDRPPDEGPPNPPPHTETP